jgi:hypothetical protein
MNLDDAQKQKVAAWISEGLKLSDIQSRIAAEFDVRLTYMDVRLLVNDLKVMPKDPEPARAAEPAAPIASPAIAPQGNPGSPETRPTGLGGGVSLTVDQLTRPGALVSGKVTFSDGVIADWYLDQTGRLGVVPKQQGYRPAPADVQAFQSALQSELAKLGI